jgi:hypothetical protein
VRAVELVRRTDQHVGAAAARRSIGPCGASSGRRRPTRARPPHGRERGHRGTSDERPERRSRPRKGDDARNGSVQPARPGRRVEPSRLVDDDEADISPRSRASSSHGRRCIVVEPVTRISSPLSSSRPTVRVSAKLSDGHVGPEDDFSPRRCRGTRRPPSVASSRTASVRLARLERSRRVDSRSTRADSRPTASITSSGTCVPAGPSKQRRRARQSEEAGAHGLDDRAGWRSCRETLLAHRAGRREGVVRYGCAQAAELSEAECYARCYGSGDDQVSVLKVEPRGRATPGTSPVRICAAFSS